MKMGGIDFQGVMTYPSNLRAKPFITETLDLLAHDGIPVNIISGGRTGSEAASKELGCTETRSGSYVYEGMTRVGNSEMLSPDRCVLRVIVTVVSTPTPERIIIDGGMKTFTSYPPKPYGHIIEPSRCQNLMVCPLTMDMSMSVSVHTNLKSVSNSPLSHCTKG